jgi:membrane protein DedA with SNARE-associated domain
MNHALQLAQPWLADYGYPGLFVAVFLEGFGIPMPGQTGLMAAALLARHGNMNIAWVFATATTAAFAGDMVGFWIGQRWGKAPLQRLALAKHAWARIEDAYVKYGGLIIVLARFVEGFRQLNGIVAGAMGMPWRRFLIYNAIGAVLWCGVWGLGVYFAADAVMRLWAWTKPLHTYGMIAAGTAVTMTVVYLLWRTRIRRRG